MASKDFEVSFRTPELEAYQVLAFRFDERLGRPAEAVVTIQLAEYVEPEALCGAEGELAFMGAVGEPRLFRGIVEAVTLLASSVVGDVAMHKARVRVVSRMALLAGNIGSAIYQELDVKEIITKVLEESGIDAGLQSWKLTGSYPKREYCVRYGESALDFVSRLCEKEGIYFRSEASDEGEVIIFEDDSTLAPLIEGDPKLPFRQRMGLEVAEQEVVYSIVERGRVTSGKFTLRDYDFERPKLNLTSEAEGEDDTDLEVYDFPGMYVEPSEGKRLAKVLLEAETASRSVLFVESDCARLSAGRCFAIAEALSEGLNREYMVVSVTHEYGYGRREGMYSVRAELVPADVRYRLPASTPVPVIEGPQTARVVAPKGSQAEEIHTDEHGRCKVKFHWDLGPDEDDKASCWMRVGQLQTSGSMVLPRVDWEVIVEFLEGSPDRPMVTGRLYNGAFMPPYALPEGKTRTSLQSATTPGGAGRNEIRLEDRAGAEEIMIRAQYNQSITTANNKSKNVGNCETREVKVDSSTTVGSNQEVKITKGHKTQVGADQSVSVGANRSMEVNAVSALSVGGSSSTSVGGNHFEMDGNPLQALLALAAQKAAEFAAAKGAEALASLDAAVQSKVDQVMGPINALQTQVEELGSGMQAVANGDLSAAPGLLAAAGALPMPGAFGSALGGGQTASRAGDGPAASTSGVPSAQGIAAELMLDQAMNNAIQHGVNSAANALGEALGLDAQGGGGESEANEAGPEGSVEGVDAEDRAKGPGHSTSMVSGSYTESVGSVKVTAALNGIMTNVAGNTTQTIGAARVDMALGNRAVDVGGNKAETAVGLVVVSRADETEQVGAAKTTMVGGAILEKIGGGHAISAGAPATFLGAFHKLEASGAITLKCGASEVVIDGGGITLTSPLVTITAGKIALTKVVSEV